MLVSKELGNAFFFFKRKNQTARSCDMKTPLAVYPIVTRVILVRLGCPLQRLLNK